MAKGGGRLYSDGNGGEAGASGGGLSMGEKWGGRAKMGWLTTE